MLSLPEDMFALLVPFAPLFSRRVWRDVPVLVVGAIVAPGRRMVSTVLRAVGLGQLPRCQDDHRVLSRAVWSSRQASQILLGLLITTRAPEGPLVLGIDEPIERRRGQRSAAAGSSRDPVRSRRRHFVKVRGRRWFCLMLLVPAPWARRVCALPFLGVLAPAGRASQRRGRRSKPLTSWARQMLPQVHRWPPGRARVVVGDRTSAALELLDAVRAVTTVVTRLRLDARLFAPPPPRRPHQQGRPRRVGERLPNPSDPAQDPERAWTSLTIAHRYGAQDRPVAALSPTAVGYPTGFPPAPIRWAPIRGPRGAFPTQALRCTDLAAGPRQLLARSVQRWQLEATCHEARAHLGVETQRRWAAPAIARTTPALFGLFSLVTPLAHPAPSMAPMPRPHTAW